MGCYGLIQKSVVLGYTPLSQRDAFWAKNGLKTVIPCFMSISQREVQISDLGKRAYYGASE